MLTCQEVTELVTDYLEGRQPLLQRMKFQLHLGMCRHCRAYLQQMRFTLAALKQLSSDAAASAIPSEVLERFRSFKKTP